MTLIPPRSLSDRTICRRMSIMNGLILKSRINYVVEDKGKEPVAVPVPTPVPLKGGLFSQIPMFQPPTSSEGSTLIEGIKIVTGTSRTSLSHPRE